MAALIADRANVAGLFVVGTNHRYPVVAPRLDTCNGRTRLAEPIPVDTDIRIGEGQDFAIRRHSVQGVQKVVNLLAGGLGQARDEDLDVEGVRSAGQLFLEPDQLLVRRVGRVLDDQEQVVILVVLLEKGAEVGAETSVDPLARDDQGRAGPIAEASPGGQPLRNVVIVADRQVHNKQLDREHRTGYGQIPVHRHYDSRIAAKDQSFSARGCPHI